MFLWNVEKCLRIFSRVYVSSDNDWILEDAENAGAIPIKRPIELCGDTPSVPVFQHALQFMNGVDGVISVQANSPTVDSKLIEQVKSIMEKYKPDEIMTCYPDGKFYGSIWGISTKRLVKYQDPYKQEPKILLVDKSVDIHTMDDFTLALNEHAKSIHRS